MRNPLFILWRFPQRALRALLLPFFLPRRSAIALIALYQATLSPDHGLLKDLFPYGYCRHSPTCSAYGRRVIGRWGVVIGGILLLRRILSCHPWARVSDERLRQAIDVEPDRGTIPPCEASSSPPTPAPKASPTALPGPTPIPALPQDTPPTS